MASALERDKAKLSMSTARLSKTESAKQRNQRSTGAVFALAWAGVEPSLCLCQTPLGTN